MKKAGKLWTAAEMYPLIRQWHSSGQSKSAFCTSHNIRLHTFYYWQQKYREEKSVSDNGSGEFVELQISSSEAPLKREFEICCPNEVHLKFGGLPSPSFLGALIKEMLG